MLYTIILWTSSITLPLPCVVYNNSLDKQYYSPLACVVYNHSLGKQYYSPLTQCCIQSFSGQAVLLSPYPVLYIIILWTSSITLPLPCVVYNHSLDKQHYSPLARVVYILWASSITLPLPCVVYNHSLDKQHNSPLACVVYNHSLDRQYYSPLTLCCI